MRRPTAESVARALERFAGVAGGVSLRDLNLLADEAARVGRDVLRQGRWRLGVHVDLRGPGMGYDAVAEAFRGDPEFPKLREIACRVTTAAGGDPAKAAQHFRNEMCVYARNHAKKLLGDANPPGRDIRRNILLHIDPAMRRRARIYFLAPRTLSQRPIPSEEFVDELWQRLDHGEKRMPQLLDATRAILAERPEYAPWIDLAQLESDYLEVMTLRSVLPGNEVPEADPGEAVDFAAVLGYWRDQGRQVASERFAARTETSPEDAPRVFAAYCDYFDVWVRTTGRVVQHPFLERLIPGLTPERFRREYRRTFQGLHSFAIDLLRHQFASQAPPCSALAMPAPPGKAGRPAGRQDERPGWR